MMENNNTQLPADVLERIELEAKQCAFYNYVTASNDAIFDNFETWPQYAQVAYYSIKHYMQGDISYWPHANKTLAMEYATKLHQEQKVLEAYKKDHKINSDLLDTAIDLLEKFISRHEAGLLPDRFIYQEIKNFLDGK